ncbi:MAG: NAD(P)H-hydrate dehydratase [Bacteroidales bacterium]|nr:NAD(P)H-hydrate dehydratase [Bacteroidales bacterium]
MKIVSCEQIKEIDSYTISHEPIASIDLMERASAQLFNWITGRYGISEHFVIFAGTGNNGGDGLALARMLGSNGYMADVQFISVSDKISDDCRLNLDRLQNVTNVTINTIKDISQLPFLRSGDIIIDAIFGSGLTRPVTGLPAEVISMINKTDSLVISIDLPSGLFGEDNTNNSDTGIIRADYTLTFQFPKLSFMFPENAEFAGEWIVLPIGLDEKAIQTTVSPYRLLLCSDILPLLKSRNKFDHKGTYGHGLLIAGSEGKMGAAVLGAWAALRSGAGLITCHIPSGGNLIIQSSVSEAMVINDRSEKIISGIGPLENFTAVGIGPGIGTDEETQLALKSFLAECKKPLVIDADALNIISLNIDLLQLLPSSTILTPHPKEFERLIGKTKNSYERLQKQIAFSEKYNCIVLLKGAHSTITIPSGEVFFNSTGNPGMATGGSGDVLTGIILSLLSQGYSPENAAITGVYLHGLAGDIAAEESCYESIIASDIINCIGKAFNKIRSNGVKV